MTPDPDDIKIRGGNLWPATGIPSLDEFFTNQPEGVGGDMSNVVAAEVLRPPDGNKVSAYQVMLDPNTDQLVTVRYEGCWTGRHLHQVQFHRNQYPEQVRRDLHNVKNNPSMIRREPKIGRNDPCRCGSGKKFKKCCGR